jgi:hypothetical protein
MGLLGPPKVMKMGGECDIISPARKGRGRYRSGEVEAARESDPERVFLDQSVCVDRPRRKGDST